MLIDKLITCCKEVRCQSLNLAVKPGHGARVRSYKNPMLNGHNGYLLLYGKSWRERGLEVSRNLSMVLWADEMFVHQPAQHGYQNLHHKKKTFKVPTKPTQREMPKSVRNVYGYRLRCSMAYLPSHVGILRSC